MIRISDKIILKPISAKDIDDIFYVINRERSFLRKWLPFVDKTKDRSDIARFVDKVIETKEKSFTIKENDNFIGLIGIHNIDMDNRKAEIGYWLSEKKQGKGIVSNSVKVLLSIAFVELDLNSIRILAATDNVKSRNIPERLNFTLEGIIRDGELLVDNKFTDLAVYSILKNEFKW